ncbi:hypothetical protein AHAS_Ahas14G0216600 [Arachis hypogaea]
MTKTTSLNKLNLLSRFMGFIEDDKYLSDINNDVSEQKGSGTMLSLVRVARDYFILR